ncbi:hypothetical protein ACW95P_04470 [Candidatus Mycoplasma pogonae]
MKNFNKKKVTNKFLAKTSGLVVLTIPLALSFSSLVAADNSVSTTTTADEKQALVNKMKAKLNDLLKVEPLNELTESVKSIKLEIDSASSLDALTPIETKIQEVIKLVTQLKVKITELENEKKTNVNKFNLSDEARKVKFDQTVNKLKTFLTENLFENNKLQLIADALAATIDLSLNGNFNLSFAINQIYNLDYLSVSQRSQALLLLNNESKMTSKEILETNVQRFKDIDSQLEKSTVRLYLLRNLSLNAQNVFTDEIRGIDISEITVAQLQTKINEILDRAKKINTKYTNLEVAYYAYKNEMSKANYIDATPAVKTAQDKNVLDALDSILEDAVLPSPKQDLVDKFKPNITVEMIDAAIAKINAAFSALDGNTNLSKYKAAIRAKTTASGEFSSLSELTKAAINSEIAAANFLDAAELVEIKANRALIILNEIDATIKKLNESTTTISYTLANDYQINQVNKTLNDLAALRNTNLLLNSASRDSNYLNNQAQRALDKLNGNTNLNVAKSRVASFSHIPADQNAKAQSSLPTTSLSDLLIRVNDLEEVNNVILKNKLAVAELAKLSDEFRSHLKLAVAAIDVEETKAKNISDSNTVATKAILLNAKYSDFHNTSENYISLHQTSVYAASTNQKEQDEIVITALNTVLSDMRQDLAFNFITNTFKYGTDMAKVEKAITVISQAIKNLNGAKIIEETKAKLLEEFTTNPKYQQLPAASQATLAKLINEINPNHSDWKEKLQQLLDISDNAVNQLQTINSQITLAQTNGDISKVLELQQLKQVDLVALAFDNIATSQTNANKAWWFLSLLGLIPVIGALLFIKFRKKNKS